MHKRLHWNNTIPAKAPFQCPEDWKILYNDWPYGVDRNIIHLVVWTKFALPEDPATGDMTNEIRASIDEFVSTTFGEVGEDQILWFRNWKSLKSVESVEHFHVMLFNPDPLFVANITAGDKPFCNSFVPT
jgi:hypothetical protein